jgi:hypothetical protein
VRWYWLVLAEVVAAVVVIEVQSQKSGLYKLTIAAKSEIDLAASEQR